MTPVDLLRESLVLESAEAKYARLGSRSVEYVRDRIPVGEQAPELLPLGVFGVAEREDVRRVADDRLPLDGRDPLLALLAYPKDRSVLREDRHPTSGYVLDPPLVAVLRTLHLWMDVALEVRGYAAIAREAVDRVCQVAPD